MADLDKARGLAQKIRELIINDLQNNNMTGAEVALALCYALHEVVKFSGVLKGKNQSETGRFSTDLLNTWVPQNSGGKVKPERTLQKIGKSVASPDTTLRLNSTRMKKRFLRS